MERCTKISMGGEVIVQSTPRETLFLSMIGAFYDQVERWG